MALFNRKEKQECTNQELEHVCRKLQKENEELSNALRQMQETSRAKSDFLLRLSHELRNPMNTIINLAEITLGCGDLPETARENLWDILYSGEYLKTLLNNSMDMNMIEQGRIELHFEPAAFDSMIAYLGSSIGTLAKEKGIHFRIDAGQCAGACFLMDRVRIQQIVFNLLSNAVKYTPFGGSIEFVMQCGKSTAGAGQSCVKLIVRDTGIGIRPEFLAKLYEPFTRDNHACNTSQEGIGLGLAISKRLVELMGGTIHVSSQEGAGTEFLVQFDFVRMKEEGKQGQHEQAAARLEEKWHILLCEDNRLNAKTIKTILENLYCEVDIAENGKDAIRLFAKSAVCYYDLIFMDNHMPVMNGMEATRHMRSMDREEAGEIPIIAMTASDDRAERKEFEKAGITAYLVKPVNTAGLKHILERYLS